MYKPVFVLWPLIVLPTLVCAVPYIAFVDARMIEPRDAYWHVGGLVSRRWSGIDWQLLREHVLAWTVKGFFLPMMVVFLIMNLNSFINQSDSIPGYGYVHFVLASIALLLILDVYFAVVGY